jgi:hypothetical protein
MLLPHCMKWLNRCIFAWLAAHLALAALCAQPPILIQPQTSVGGAASPISNVRVGKPSADGTELTLTLDFSYDGLHGQEVRIAPVISDKAHPEVSRWFGADTKTVGIGHGTISIKVKYFNDEPGVPAQLTTDRIRVMMLNSSGTSVIGAIPILDQMGQSQRQASSVAGEQPDRLIPGAHNPTPLRIQAG